MCEATVTCHTFLSGNHLTSKNAHRLKSNSKRFWLNKWRFRGQSPELNTNIWSKIKVSSCHGRPKPAKNKEKQWVMNYCACSPALMPDPGFRSSSNMQHSMTIRGTTGATNAEMKRTITPSLVKWIFDSEKRSKIHEKMKNNEKMKQIFIFWHLDSSSFKFALQIEGAL